MNGRKIIRGTCAILFGAAVLLAGDAKIGEAFEGCGIRYFLQKPDAEVSDTPYGNNTAAGRYAKADDAKIYYEVYGEGRPLFVFHGGGVGTPYEMGRLRDWNRKLSPALEKIVDKCTVRWSFLRYSGCDILLRDLECI